MTDKERELLQKLKQKEADEKKELAKKQRQFKDMCKQQFGMTPTEIMQMISNDKNVSIFEQKIATFYELESELDRQLYLDTMLNANSKRYWDSKRTPHSI